LQKRKKDRQETVVDLTLDIGGEIGDMPWTGVYVCTIYVGLNNRVIRSSFDVG
jgi:hypothetical protein